MPPKIEKAQKEACGGDDAVQKCPLSSKITVTVRMAFFNPGEGESFAPGLPVVGATFKIDGAARGPATREAKPTVGLPPTVAWAPLLGARSKVRDVGLSEIPVGDLADGNHTLEIVPPPGQDSSAPAGSKTTRPGAGKHRYRPIYLGLSLKGGKIVARPTILDVVTPVTYVYVVAWDDSAIAIDWKPDWVSNNFVHSARPKKLSLVIVHSTDHPDTGNVFSGAYNQAQAKAPTKDWDQHGWHYMLDHDGQVLKFIEEKYYTSNAAPAVWKGDPDVNYFSVGVELVPFPNHFGENQYAALIRLLRDILAAHDIPAHRIVGHSDVDVDSVARAWVPHPDPYMMDVHRGDDPGPGFEWTRLEAVGLGMIPKAGTPRNQGWAEYFATSSDSLRPGDNDDHAPESSHKTRWKKWGGADRTAMSLTGVIRGLQADLLRIGYSVAPPDGKFDAHLASAVGAFKRHFLTGTRGPFPGPGGTVDADTAWLIQAVAAFVEEADNVAALKALVAIPVDAAKAGAAALGTAARVMGFGDGAGGAPAGGSAPPSGGSVPPSGGSAPPAGGSVPPSGGASGSK